MAEKSMENTGASENVGTISVACGSNSIVNAAGSSVADLRNKLKKVLNIDPNTRALVNGAVVTDEASFIVQDGMTLEFVKESGVKGK